jgi:hypothetical protein
MVSSNTPQARPKADVQEAAMKPTSVMANNAFRLMLSQFLRLVETWGDRSEIS